MSPKHMSPKHMSPKHMSPKRRYHPKVGVSHRIYRLLKKPSPSPCSRRVHPSWISIAKLQLPGYGMVSQTEVVPPCGNNEPPGCALGIDSENNGCTLEIDSVITARCRATAFRSRRVSRPGLHLVIKLFNLLII